MSVVFRPGERERIEAAEEAVRDLLAAEFPEVRRPGFLFLTHHRWARAEIRRKNTGAGIVRFGEIAALMLDWAREQGDVRVYAWQPAVHWALRVEASGRASSLISEAMAGVGRAQVDFISYARQRTAATESV